MMFNEIKSGDIPILSFLKGTDYAMYVGPDLNPRERQQYTLTKKTAFLCQGAIIA